MHQSQVKVKVKVEVEKGIRAQVTQELRAKGQGHRDKKGTLSSYPFAH